MSYPLIEKEKEKQLKVMASQLNEKAKESVKNHRKVIEIDSHAVKEILNLLDSILVQQPIVVQEDLTPNEAAELAGVSRPVIMDMIKSGGLEAYPVKSHWRITKNSLLKYISERSRTRKAIAAMDEDGFGLD